MNIETQVRSLTNNEWDQLLDNIWDLYFMHHPSSPMPVAVASYDYNTGRVELIRRVMLYLCEVK